MKRFVGLAGAALVAAVSITACVVSLQTKMNAHSTLDRAERLYEARLQVVRAQEALGASDLDDAIRSARKANATAGRVKKITTEIARLLATAESAATATSRATRAAVQDVTLTRQETVATSDVLAVIAGYQGAAKGFADDTNGALLRILRALRKTNRSFPGGG